MQIYVELGDRHAIGGQLANLASAAFDAGDYIRAITLQNESLAIARDLGDDLEIALGLLLLAGIRLAQKDLDRAELEFREALESLYELGDKWSILDCLEGLAAVANGRGQFRRAARLLGASEQQATVIGGFRKGYGAQLVLLPAIEAARAGLSQSEFEAAWAEGQGMSLEQVVAYALQALKIS